MPVPIAFRRSRAFTSPGTQYKYIPIATKQRTQTATPPSASAMTTCLLQRATRALAAAATATSKSPRYADTIATVVATMTITIAFGLRGPWRLRLTSVLSLRERGRNQLGPTLLQY